MKTINIAGTEIPMLVNAATSMVHQRIFNEDVLVEYNRIFANKTEKELEEDMELSLKAASLVKHLAFTMAMQAQFVGKEEKLLTLGEGNFIKWISQFEDPFALENVTEEIMAIYAGDDTPTAEPKKEAAPQTDH